jgi:hypothetical protein
MTDYILKVLTDIYIVIIVAAVLVFSIACVIVATPIAIAWAIVNEVRRLIIGDRK